MRTVWLLAAGLVAGCGSRDVPAASPKVELVPPKTGSPVALAPPDRDDGVPLSIKRLVREQKSELRDVVALAAVVGDARGRARAIGEVNGLVTELTAIESSLPRAEGGFDEPAARLILLEQRIGDLHDALRAAAPDLGSPKAIE
ncbi:MAG: hypothetical protein KF819_12335 [Labilithrix sp.]|nr:hypothetical protein [Labilithrix sp.]